MSTQLLTTQESLAIDVWVRLLRGHAAARRKLSAELHSAHRLTVNDYEALLLLSRSKDNVMRRVDLAEALQLTASGVTRLLDGLEEHGLVEKATCSSDARVTYAKLTKTGREKLRKASSSHIAGVRGAVRGALHQQASSPRSASCSAGFTSPAATQATARRSRARRGRAAEPDRRRRDP